MTPQHAQMILQFLQRVDLKGAEALAMAECMMVLRALAMPEPPVEKPEKK